MNTRRNFFKGLATFVGGIAAAKASTYIPKKEEPKEELMVTSTITIKHEGEEYHPLVVKKTDKDGMEYEEQPKNTLSIGSFGKPKIRKADI